MRLPKKKYDHIYIYARLFPTIYTPELQFFHMDLFDSTLVGTVTSTGSVTDEKKLRDRWIGGSIRGLCKRDR